MITQENDFVKFTFENSLLLVALKNKTPSDAEWEFTKRVMLSYYEANISKNTKFSIICNMEEMSTLPLHRTLDWSKLFLNKIECTKKCILCTAFVTTSKVVRTTMDLFFRLYSPVRPTTFVGSHTEAQSWIANQNVCMSAV